MASQKTKRICANGHSYFKSSSCPVCPVCEAAGKPEEGFMNSVAAPARRALLANQINSLKDLSDKTQKEVSTWHGIGRHAISILAKCLAAAGLAFKKDSK